MIVYRLVIGFLRLVYLALGLRVDIRGAEHIPVSGPAVLASNHISFMDFTFVGAAARESNRFPRFMARRRQFSGLSGTVMRAMGHIEVDRIHGASAYRKAARALDCGDIVGLFPEGTISRAWTLKPFKLGAATLSVDRQVPLIPVITWGGHRILGVDGRWSVRRGKAITVLVGEPMVPGDDPAALDAELRVQLQALLDDAQSTFPDRPTGDDDRWWIPAHLGGTAPDAETAAPIDAAAAAAADVPRRRRSGTSRR